MTTNNFKPILFSTEMVQAILAGRKTQTRRIIKIKTTPFIENLSEESMKKHLESPGAREIYGGYNAGEILWVRETFGVHEGSVQGSYAYSKGEEVKYPPHFLQNGIKRCIDFKADYPKSSIKWKPSIFMPKEAARIFLKVTNVRVERLQDISEEDAVEEGITVSSEVGSDGHYYYKDYCDKTDLPIVGWMFAYTSFKTLWQSINAKKHPWESNPWVWVYEFERIEKPENFI